MTNDRSPLTRTEIEAILETLLTIPTGKPGDYNDHDYILTFAKADGSTVSGLHVTNEPDGVLVGVEADERIQHQKVLWGEVMGLKIEAV